MAKGNNNNSKQRKGVKSFIGGAILTDERVTRQLPFILMLVFLLLFLIANRNSAEKTIREIEALQDNIKELRSESITISEKLMDISKPSEIINKVKEANIGLEEPLAPPRKITIKTD